MLSAYKVSILFPIQNTGCFLSMIMETRTPPRSPHKQSPESVASCQLQQHGPESVRLSGPATAIHCYTLQGCRLNNRVDRVFCTLAPLILDGLDTIPSRHKRHTQHHEPKLQITYPCTVVISRPPAPGTEKSFFSVLSIEYFFARISAKCSGRKLTHKCMFYCILLQMMH